MARRTGCDECAVQTEAVLRALIRTLVARGLISPSDVRALLYEAVKGMDIVVEANTGRRYEGRCEAANEVVIED